jgi:hypothetical protein
MFVNNNETNSKWIAYCAWIVTLVSVMAITTDIAFTNNYDPFLFTFIGSLAVIIRYLNKP